MKGKILSIAIILIMAIASFGAVGYNLENKENEKQIFVPGEVIIGFNSNIIVENINNFQGHVIKNKINSLNIAIVETEIGGELAFIDNIKDYMDVKFSEPNYIVYATHIPNDPFWEEQYGPTRIQCPEAWDTNQGSYSVKIAIVDTGIDYDHEDIAGNYVSGGYDHVNSDDDPYDDNSHGTHCAGIAAAVMDNNRGIAGVAQVEVMAEKVLSSGGSGSSADVAAGITHAVSQGADIISLSLGSSNPSTAIENACNDAYSSGVLLVAASGNDYSSYVGYPAAFDSVIAVGATNAQDERCSFSNYGEKLELMAPGYRIISSIPNDGYTKYSGTSMATPHVAGVAALAMSKYPNKNNEWIRQKLIDTAKDLGPDGWDEEYGHGLVDARLGGGEEGAIVEVLVHKVKALDDIDPWPNTEAEWFYRVSIDDEAIVEYDGTEEQFLFWWIMNWNSRNTWTPDKTYSFTAKNPEVTMKVKLMDDDVAFNDVADLSERTGDSGRIFTITYDLINNQMSGDRNEYDGTYHYTRGDWDEIPGDDDDAQFWFKISDNYTPPKPADLEVDGSLTGSTVSGTKHFKLGGFTVKNTGTEDPLGWTPTTDLRWEVYEYPSWGSNWVFEPSSQGNLEPGDNQKITVYVDVPDEVNTYSGNIKIRNKDDHNDKGEVSLRLSVPRVKQSIVQIIFDIFEKLPFIQNILHLIN